VKYEQDQNCGAREEKLGDHERPCPKIKEPGHDGVFFIGTTLDEVKREQTVGNAEDHHQQDDNKSQGWY